MMAGFGGESHKNVYKDKSEFWIFLSCEQFWQVYWMNVIFPTSLFLRGIDKITKEVKVKSSSSQAQHPYSCNITCLVKPMHPVNEKCSLSHRCHCCQSTETPQIPFTPLWPNTRQSLPFWWTAPLHSSTLMVSHTNKKRDEMSFSGEWG